jgi:serine/threonine-protein kinase
MADTPQQVDPKPDSLIGTTVGDYKIIDIIGQGGMGTVYTAEHQQLHHKTACKVLRAEVANHPETVERFLQEARFISRIRHVNLIDIFDIGELPDKRLYYVMEKLHGRTLTQAIRGGKLPFATIVSITNQICAGMSAAHEAGLIHRDAYEKTMTCFRVSAKDAHRRRTSHGYSEAEDSSYLPLQLV